VPILKAILLGVAAFLAIMILAPPGTQGQNIPGLTMAAIVGILVAVAIALPN
jgi:hypothetical protein